MTPDQIAKASAELRPKSALGGASSCKGAAWLLARFNVHRGVALEISGPLLVRTLKRRERRAPFVPGAGRPVSRVSLTRGFSRVVCTANEGNGFNRFPRATAGLCAG